MKEPFLVQLIIENFNSENIIKLPLKKGDDYYTITKKRFIIFLQNKMVPLNFEMIDAEFFIEFYDQNKAEFIDDKQIYDYQKEEFFFHKEFFGAKKILKLRFILESNCWVVKKYLHELDVQKVNQEKLISQLVEQNIEKLAFQYNQYQGMKEQLEKELEKQIIKKEIADFVILYSCPLVQNINNKDSNKDWKAAKFIEYESEIQEIINIKKKPKYMIFQATRENLILALNYNPKILHLIVNGDIDLEIDDIYLEFQNDGSGSLIQFYSSEFMDQLIKKRNQGKLSKLKLICISSIIAMEFIEKVENHFQFAQDPFFTVIGQKKMFNSNDQYGNKFWGKFYSQLFNQETIIKSFNEAKKVKKRIREGICCCFHKHNDVCKTAPSKIGYSLSHQFHFLECLIRKNKKKIPEKFGQILHENDCKSDYCKYEERFQKNLGLCKNINEKSIQQFKDYKKQEKEVNICCCFEFDYLLSEKKDKGKNHYVKSQIEEEEKQLRSEKFNATSRIIQESKSIGDFDISDQEVSYLKINKQIILIISSKSKEQDEQTKNEILKYFKEFCLQKLCITYISYTYENEMKVDNFFNNQEQTFQIIIIQDIDDKCNDEQFIQFNKQLQEKFRDEKINNIVIIFISDIKNIGNIKIDQCSDFYKYIYPNY